jgi:GNAT superfamily N-acetyltransferase
MTSTKHEARVRRAQPHEAEALNEVITRSKSYWGYDPSFVEAYRSFLSLSPEAIEHHPVYCAQVGDTIAGVLHVKKVGRAEIELSHLFVEPVFIGQGIGKLLWQHGVDLARSMGANALVFDADPHARPFYEQMGAVVEGYHVSAVIAELRVPRMRYAL